MNKTITKLIGQEEFTYCNCCSRYVEIVSYNEDLDLALCVQCKGRPRAIASYLRALIETNI
jgi:hypothetical protein